MFPLVLAVVACIPREEPPDKVLYLNEFRNLPVTLNENSGMTAIGESIWFINDSGNDSVLYEYQPESNTVTRSVAIKGAVNKDWEELTQDEDNLYIGDFGNNLGSRRDLRIICIRKADMQSGADTVVPFGIIHFSYSDQTDFTPANENTPYDCEAFIADGNQLILFTKDWVSRKTKVYTIPAIPGTYSADLTSEWDIGGGLVTGAAWSSEVNTLFIIGYTPLWPFLLVFNEFDPGNITNSSYERTDFIEFAGTQTEAIAMNAQGTLFVSSESFGSKGPQMFYVREEISK